MTNALRLNLFKLHDASNDKRIKNAAVIPESAFAVAEQTSLSPAERTLETRTLHVDGMVCENCQEHVTKALEAVPGVAKADVDHESGLAVVTLIAPVTEEAFRDAIAGAGYTLVSVAGSAEAAQETRTLHVDGMVCENCQAHVTKALEALPGVVKADVDHETGLAVVTLSASVSEEAFRDAIAGAGYTLISIE